MISVVLNQPAAQGLRGLALLVGIDSGIDFVTAGVQIWHLAHHLLAHPFRRIGTGQIEFARINLGGYWRSDGFVIGAAGNGLLIEHAAEYLIAAT